jgi:tryptophan 2,3-dioxygenase
MDESVPNYTDYLKLGEMLKLQGGLENDEASLIPDELLFIVVHQALELWFKIVNRELRLARDHLAEPRVPEETVPHVVHHLRRINRVLELAVEHFKVMETLTPQDFLGFREKITPASGFQSSQMREMEILLGMKSSQRVRYGKVDPIKHLEKLGSESKSGEEAWKKVKKVQAEQTFQEALRTWLYRTPIHGSMPGDENDEQAVQTFIDDYIKQFDGFMDQQCVRLQESMPETGDNTKRFESAKEAAREFLLALDAPEEDRSRLRRIRAGLLFIESYRQLPLLAWPRLLIDSVVELEQLTLIWRNRHARMVERMIGRRVGTGGSSGVDYLDMTGKVRIFTDLWAVRTVMMPKDSLPPLGNPDFYGFAT